MNDLGKFQVDVCLNRSLGISHGRNLIVAGGFGASLSFLLEPIILLHGRGHESFVGESSELVIKVFVIVALDACLEM